MRWWTFNQAAKMTSRPNTAQESWFFSRRAATIKGANLEDILQVGPNIVQDLIRSTTRWFLRQGLSRETLWWTKHLSFVIPTTHDSYPTYNCLAQLIFFESKRPLIIEACTPFQGCTIFWGPTFLRSMPFPSTFPMPPPKKLQPSKIRRRDAGEHQPTPLTNAEWDSPHPRRQKKKPNDRRSM